MRLKQRQLAALARPYYLVSPSACDFYEAPPLAQKERRVLLLTNAIAVAINKLDMARAGASSIHEMAVGLHFYYAIASHVGFRPDENLGVLGRQVGIGHFMGQTVFLVADNWCANIAFVNDDVRSVRITAVC